MATIDQIQNLELERRGILLAPHTNLQDGSSVIGFDGNPNEITLVEISSNSGKKLLWEITRGSHYVNYSGEEYIKINMPGSATSMSGCWSKILTGESGEALTKNDYDAFTILAAMADNDPETVIINSGSVLGRLGNIIQSINLNTDLTVSTSDEDIPTSKAVNDFVNDVLTGALSYKGGYNVLTDTTDNTGEKLQSSPYATIYKGDTYLVTTAGTFFTTDLEVADMIVSTVDSPTLESDWTLVIKNIPNITDASETEKGIIRIATDSEVLTGTDNTVAITPKNLKTRLDLLIRKYSALISNINEDLTSFEIPNSAHGLNTSDLNIIIKDNISGEFVEVETKVASNYTVTIKFSTPPAHNKYKVILIG